MRSNHMANGDGVGVGRAFRAEQKSEKEQIGAGESKRGAREEGTWGEGGRWAEHPRLTLVFSSSLFPLLFLKARLQEENLTSEGKQTPLTFCTKQLLSGKVTVPGCLNPLLHLLPLLLPGAEW